MEPAEDDECGCRRVETDGSGAFDAGDPLELDTLLQMVEHSRRRYTLYALRERSELSLSELATMIVSSEEGVPPEEVDETTRDRAFIALYHAHVPKLEQEGVVLYDRGTGTVTLGPNGRQALEALEGIGGARDASQEEHARNVSHD